MLTTPEQRAAWAKLYAEELDEESNCLKCNEINVPEEGNEQSRFCDGCAQSLAETAVPSLLADVEELLRIADYLQPHELMMTGECYVRCRRCETEKKLAEERGGRP